MTARSYLFVPGHNSTLVTKVFDAGADAVILDLEDAVPPQQKAAARALVADTLTHHAAWVRINPAHTQLAAADLDAVGAHALGIRIPKVESVDDVRWVARRAPGKPIICAIETASGVIRALDIAGEPDVIHLAMGGIDLRKDLNVGDGEGPLQYARSHLVVASRAAGIAPPIDSVYPNLHDDAGLRAQAELARSLGFAAKSAIHPRQLPIIHAAFDATDQEVAWARRVLDGFRLSSGEAFQLPDGEFVDLPVADRARTILERRALRRARR